MYIETSSTEILMIVAAWFLSKKKIRAGIILTKMSKKTSMNVHRNQG